MRWVPRFVANGVSTTLSYPQRLWRYRSRGTGGSDTSAAGVDESFQIRRDRLARVTLVFTDAEWPAVQAWLEHAQRTGAAFTFAFDVTRAPTYEYSMLLVEPAMGDDIEPTRSTQFHGMWEIDVLMRTANGGNILVPYDG